MKNHSLLKKYTISSKALFIIGIVFVAFNLRPAITSVGPLISSIRIDTGISNGLAGLLTTLPLIAFALLSPVSPKIGQKLGNELTVLIGLFVLAGGILIRSTGFIFTLYAGTALVGLGIAVCNVLLPGIIKSRFPEKVGLMTSIYSTSMVTWAALASGVSVPIARGLGLGWQMSLAVWVILAGAAFFLWLPQIRHQQSSIKLPAMAPTKNQSLWRSPLAWQVTIFMGLQSLLFYCMIAWLPEILQSRSLSISTAGWMLSLMQFASLPSTFITPILADRLTHQKGIVIGIGTLNLLGLIGLFIGGNLLFLTLCILMIGLSQGASISLSLTLLGLRAANDKQAASLSGMAQSAGYLLAAIGPITIGLLFDLFQSWTLPLIIFILINIVMSLVGIGAGRNKFVLQDSRHDQLSL